MSEYKQRQDYGLQTFIMLCFNGGKILLPFVNLVAHRDYNFVAQRTANIHTHKLGIAGWSLKILGTSHKHSLLNVKAKSMLAVTYFTMETFSLQ